MSEHVTAWIQAYYDGELPASRRQQVEQHLQSCPSCQHELEALQKLSAMLGAVPLPASVLSPERFNQQVKLRLPRTVPLTPWQRLMRAGWGLAPWAPSPAGPSSRSF